MAELIGVEKVQKLETTLPAQVQAFGISGGGGFMALLSSHPPLDVRIAALREAGQPQRVSPVRRA